MKTMQSVRLKLTKEQIDALQPIFNALGAYNDVNKDLCGSVIGQLYPDGLICTFLDNETSLKVIKAIGSSNGKDKYSKLSERYKK